MAYQTGESKDPFHPATLLAKCHLRRLRFDEGLSIQGGAELLGISRKQLEDIETHQPYGCYVTWLMIITACKAYGVKPNEFVEPLTKQQKFSLTPRSAGRVHGKRKF